MTTLRPHHSSSGDRQASQDGQILVLTVVVALALLAILGWSPTAAWSWPAIASSKASLTPPPAPAPPNSMKPATGPATAAPPPSTPPRLRPQPGGTCERSGSAGRPTSLSAQLKSRSGYLRWFVL